MMADTLCIKFNEVRAALYGMDDRGTPRETKELYLNIASTRICISANETSSI